MTCGGSDMAKESVQLLVPVPKQSFSLCIYRGSVEIKVSQKGVACKKDKLKLQQLSRKCKVVPGMKRCPVDRGGALFVFSGGA